MEILLFLIGGKLYTWVELVWRGRTHWSMFILGGLCFLIIGLLNENIIPWSMPIWVQSLIGAGVITVLEFMVGCVVNLWLGWNVWDYSGLMLNILGQVCLPFTILWVILSLACIIIDDWLRYGLYIGLLWIYTTCPNPIKKIAYSLLVHIEPRIRPKYRC